ncbi:MAG: hypothetical protein NTV94_15925, partial [Planctomycetota bacterium]|nr:hypothetical protein [Planctomycetota bacterium]
GELSIFSSPPTGQFDLRFRLYDAASTGTQIGTTLCAPNVSVVNGKFTVALDFGAAFSGQQRYLEIEVRPETGLGCDPGDISFSTLSPRQQVTATPSAQFALSAASATTAINATQLNGQPASFYASAANLTSGTLASPRLAGAYTEILNLANPLNSYSGNGSLLTALSASNVNTGTLADGRLSGNVALLANAQTFTGIKTFVASPSFTSASAPFAVTSQALVNNLNADLLDGLHASAFLQAVPNPLVLTGVNSSATIRGTNTATLVFTSGVSGYSTSSSFTTYGVYGESASNQGVGVQGTSTSSSGGTTGVKGQVVSPDGVGVRGLASSATGFNAGMSGESASVDGIGVRGVASATSGNTSGVLGIASSAGGTGVEGIATAATGSTAGVSGRTNSTGGIAVSGLATASTGSTRGVYGQASSSDGQGVYGAATATTGNTYGVYAASYSNVGTGVFGFAVSATGTTAGVRAAANSPDGFGVSAAAPFSSANGRAILAYGQDSTGNGVVLEARTASASGYAAWFTGPAGSRTLFNTNVGIGELSTLAPLHITVQEQNLLPTAISNDDVIIEAADAVLGLYSSSNGNFGSAISLKELSGGTIANTWGIVRGTSVAGNLLHFTFGTSADQTANPSVLSVTP